MTLLHRCSAAIRSYCSLNRNREFTLILQCIRDASRGAFLDIGSGDGFWTDRFARHFGTAFGLEPDPRALRLAQASHGERARYVHGFAESLCFPDETFDCVVSVSCFEHFRSAQDALGEAFRVLRPGGKLAISVDSLLEQNSNPAFRSWHRRKYLVTEYFSEEHLSLMLQNAGFRVEPQHTRHLITSSFSAWVRELYLRRPRALVFLFPVLYPLVLAADRWGRQVPGQILVMSAYKPGPRGSFSRPHYAEVGDRAVSPA